MAKLIVAYAPWRINSNRIRTDMWYSQLVGYRRHPILTFNTWKFVDVDVRDCLVGPGFRRACAAEEREVRVCSTNGTSPARSFEDFGGLSALKGAVEALLVKPPCAKLYNIHRLE